MSPSVDDLLTEAHEAYGRGELHAAAAAWRQVLDVHPEHGAARDLLSAVEAEIENCLDNAFEIETEAQQVSSATGDGGLPAAESLTLPESEVELADMADLEAYDTGEVPAVTPPPSRAPTPPVTDPGSAQRFGTWELSREDTNPGAIIPGFGGAPLGAVGEAPPHRSTRRPAGVLASGDDSEEALAADEEALDTFFAEFDDDPAMAPADLPSSPDVSPEVVDPAGFDAPIFEPPAQVAPLPGIAFAPEPITDPPVASVIEPQPVFEPQPVVQAQPAVEPEPVVEQPSVGDPAPEAEADSSAFFDAPDVTPLPDADPAPEQRTVTFDPPSEPMLEVILEEILPPLLQAVPDLSAPEDDGHSDTPEGDLILEPVAPPMSIAADPSKEMLIDAMPQGPAPSRESFPEFVVAASARATALRTPPPDSAPPPDGGTLSGVITKKRPVAAKSVVENTGSESRVDLFSGESDSEGRGETMEFTSGPDDAPAGGLASAVAAFQQGDPIGAYDAVTAVIHEDPEDSGAAEFRDRIKAECERALLTQIGPVDSAPSLAITSAGLTGLDLDHKAGFVLAQIDGFVSFEEVMDLSGMARIETLRILVRLLDASVITR